MRTRRATESGLRVVVAGGGLAGLTAARLLERAGASVTVVEARDRVGGRVHTLRHGFAAGQHAEAGGDLIEEEQGAVLDLARELNLRPVEILRSGWGFYGSSGSGATVMRRHPDALERAARLLAPEIAALNAAEGRRDGGIARTLARESVAAWLDRVGAGADLRAGLRGLRGFYLADPEHLSLLTLVEQFASGDIPGQARMYRLREGNDALPAAIARALRGRILLNTVLRAVDDRGPELRIVVDDGSLQQLAAEYLVVAVPATTLREVRFEPPLPVAQQRAIERLRYGAATRVLLQFSRRFWRRVRRPTAYGTDQVVGAVWDGNEEQAPRPGILSLLAGGNASREVRSLLHAGSWSALVTELAWLGRPSRVLAAHRYTWEDDPWARGGYAVFDPQFDPALRSHLARPHGRVVFAGEHTSGRWQGYMNGAVETGRRAAVEILIDGGSVGVPG